MASYIADDDFSVIANYGSSDEGERDLHPGKVTSIRKKKKSKNKPWTNFANASTAARVATATSDDDVMAVWGSDNEETREMRDLSLKEYEEKLDQYEMEPSLVDSMERSLLPGHYGRDTGWHDTDSLATIPAFGDRIEMKRTIMNKPYQHWGISLGGDKIANFNVADGATEKLSKLLVEKGGKAQIRDQSLKKVAGSSKVRINNSDDAQHFPPGSIPTRQTLQANMSAFDNEGKKYNFLTNNCEHFTNAIRYGKKYSAQAEKIIEKLPGKHPAYLK